MNQEMNPQMKHAQKSAAILPLHPPSSWHDPLGLICTEAPSSQGRIVLWSVALLSLLLFGWALIGQLDVIISAEGKLTPQTLIKIVQPAEAGILKALLVKEGDQVKAWQVLARLNTTMAQADSQGLSSDLRLQKLEERRIQAELQQQPLHSLRSLPGDALSEFEQIKKRFDANRSMFADSVAQEQAMFVKAENDLRGAAEILRKLEQSLPSYKKTAEAYRSLKTEGFIGDIAADEKIREAHEKEQDLAAQNASVAAAQANLSAQQTRIRQLQSSHDSQLQKELAEVRARIMQLQPNLQKSQYREGLMELVAPQDGIIKDLATSTLGAVLQPGAVLLTLVPNNELPYADVNISNADVGFVREQQSVRIKLTAYPFQKYGMLKGEVLTISADASELGKSNPSSAMTSNKDSSSSVDASSTYKARIALNSQNLLSPQGSALHLSPGMHLIAEINQGQRSVIDYLLSPLQKVVQEAGRER